MHWHSHVCCPQVRSQAGLLAQQLHNIMHWWGHGAMWHQCMFAAKARPHIVPVGSLAVLCSLLESINCAGELLLFTGLLSPTCSPSSSSPYTPKTSPYRGSPASSTGGLPQPPAWYPNWVPGGMGAFSPGICRASRTVRGCRSRGHHAQGSVGQQGLSGGWRGLPALTRRRVGRMRLPQLPAWSSELAMAHKDG